MVASEQIAHNLARAKRVGEPREGIRPAGEHLYWIDWLRFSAAFVVVLCHARGSTWVAWSELAEGSRNRLSAVLFAVTRPGLEAVVVFFALSGFLVGGRVLARWRDDRFDLKRYCVDRVSRIYVPLIPALIFSGIVALAFDEKWSWLTLLGNIVGLQGVTCDVFGRNGPLWSLAYEIWFYVLAGCCVSIVRRNDSVNLVSWILLGISCAMFTKLRASYLICWFIGAIAYLSLGKLFSGPLILGSIVALVGGVGFSQLASNTASLSTAAVQSFLPSRDFAVIVLTLGVAILLPFLSTRRPGGRAASLERVGSVLASFSYTLYLVHAPVVSLVIKYSNAPYRTIDKQSIGWFCAAVTVSLVVAWLLYLPFERQTARVRHWLTTKSA